MSFILIISIKNLSSTIHSSENSRSEIKVLPYKELPMSLGVRNKISCVVVCEDCSRGFIGQVSDIGHRCGGSGEMERNFVTLLNCAQKYLSKPRRLIQISELTDKNIANGNVHLTQEILLEKILNPELRDFVLLFLDPINHTMIYASPTLGQRQIEFVKRVGTMFENVG